MKTNRKSTPVNAVQTLDESAGTRGETTPLRPVAGRKVKHTPLSSKSGAGAQVRPTHEQIAERARTIWLEQGCLAGQDEQNWHDAEAQLKAELRGD